MNIIIDTKSKITYMDITLCIRFKFMIIRLINIILFMIDIEVTINHISITIRVNRIDLLFILNNKLNKVVILY